MLQEIPSASHPSFGDAVKVWWKIALLSFGGPAGQIALMHRYLVDENKWVSDQKFLRALNFSMLLPGPEAQQLATYIGWSMHGVRGGLTAGGLFILPGMIVMMLLSILYVSFGNGNMIQGVFFGLKAAVLAIILQAIIKLSARAIGSLFHAIIAISAFAMLFIFAVPFPLVVVGAAIMGWLWHHIGRTHIAAADDDGYAPPKLSKPIILTLIAAWIVPLIGIMIWLNPDNIYTDIGIFFSKMSLVTFGGAYAALAYVGQEAVSNYGWMQPGEMLDGLGLAETTPGPLVIVLQHVGFLAAYRDAGILPPMAAGILGGLLTTWVTFIPCFLWIFLFGPWMERLQKLAALSSALSAVTAAIVGVIANLGLWFALHYIFTKLTMIDMGPVQMEWPQWSSANDMALLLSCAACFAAFRLRMNIFLLIGIFAAAGLVLQLSDLI